tara:strand:- start:95 stop:430 length:336 start_codon:yes stop_codon:yes gene_type:complete
MKMKHKPKALTPLFFAALLVFGSPRPDIHSAGNTASPNPEGPPAAVKTSFESVVSRLDPNDAILFVCPHHPDAFGAAFADGHVEIMKWPRISQRFRNQENPIELPIRPWQQ